MKICKTCGVEKDDKEFLVALTKGEKVYRRRECKSCQKPKKNAQRRARTDRFLEYRKTLKCNRCGNSDYRVLEFHHVDGDSKVGNVTVLASHWTLEKLMGEIEKCECLCANCHRIVHHELRQSVA